VQRHVKVGIKEGMRGTRREGETRGTLHRLSGGRGRAARTVVAGASSEAGVTKCVRGKAAGSYSRAKRWERRQTAPGTPNINRQRTSNDSAVENVSREVMWDVSALGQVEGQCSC